MKYLLLLLVLLGLFFLIKRVWRLSQNHEQPRPLKPEPMVQCAKCGLRLPTIEALPKGKLFFCTQEHQRLFEKSVNGE